MNKKIDVRKILDALNLVSNSTDIIVSFAFDRDFYNVEDPFSQPLTCTSNFFDLSKEHYCYYLNSTPYCLECQKTSKTYQLKAKTEKSIIKYCCPANIMTVVIPVEIDGVIVGYFLCGKFVDKKKNQSTVAKIKAVAKKYELDTNKALALYKELPVISDRRLNSTIILLNEYVKPIIGEQIANANAPNDTSSSLLSDIRDYIYEHLSESITINSICKKFFIDKRKLYTLIKNESNVTIKDFILHIRINKAKQLLLITHKTLPEIAEAVGFCDYNYFSRCFKKKTGLSPNKFRTQAKSHINYKI
jgi:AraC-like DNA-binding protein